MFKDNLLLEFIASHKLFLALLILIPFILSVSFLQVSNSDENFGDNYFRNKNIPTYADDFLNRNKDKIYEERINQGHLMGRLDGIEEMRFFNSFYNSLFTISKISIILGAVGASFSSIKLISNGSIIYYITNKSSKKVSFVEFFSLPLPFLLFSSTIASLSIFSISLNMSLIKNPVGIFIIILSTVLFSLLEGYIFGIVLGLLTKNVIIPILSIIGIVFALPLYDKSQYILMPYKPIILNLYEDIIIRNSNWLISLLIIGASLIFSFILFKRGDFY